MLVVLLQRVTFGWCLSGWHCFCATICWAVKMVISKTTGKERDKELPVMTSWGPIKKKKHTDASSNANTLKQSKDQILSAELIEYEQQRLWWARVYMQDTISSGQNVVCFLLLIKVFYIYWTLCVHIHLSSSLSFVDSINRMPFTFTVVYCHFCSFYMFVTLHIAAMECSKHNIAKYYFKFLLVP